MEEVVIPRRMTRILIAFQKEEGLSEGTEFVVEAPSAEDTGVKSEDGIFNVGDQSPLDAGVEPCVIRLASEEELV